MDGAKPSRMRVSKTPAPKRRYAAYITRVALLGLAASVFLSSALPSPAAASPRKQYRYVGSHPRGNAGYCYIEAPHVHAYAPRNAKVLYRTYDDHNYFIGDPVAYKYDGPKHAYRGSHPVPVNVVLGDDDRDDDQVEYCYLRGPHYHVYAAPVLSGFKLKGGVSWYVGTFPPRYKKERPRLARINVVYKPLRYARPVVTVEPPVGYVDSVVEVRGPMVEVRGPAVRVGRRTHARVGAGVDVFAGVEVRVPSVRLDVRLPGAIAVGHRDRYRAKRKHRSERKHKYEREHKYERRRRYKRDREWKRKHRRKRESRKRRRRYRH